MEVVPLREFERLEDEWPYWTKTLADPSKQATIPDMISTQGSRAALEDKAELVWTPPTVVDDEEVANFVEVAKESGVEEEVILEILLNNHLNILETWLDIENWKAQSPPGKLSEAEERKFVAMFKLYGKRFHKIKTNFPGRRLSTLMVHYYKWKRSGKKAHPVYQAKKWEVEEARKKLGPNESLWVFLAYPKIQRSITS